LLLLVFICHAVIPLHYSPALRLPLLLALAGENGAEGSADISEPESAFAGLKLLFTAAAHEDILRTCALGARRALAICHDVCLSF
jgi:hypothetical protein